VDFSLDLTIFVAPSPFGVESGGGGGGVAAEALPVVELEAAGAEDSTVGGAGFSPHARTRTPSRRPKVGERFG
jgi:hypothetical protein